MKQKDLALIIVVVAVSSVLSLLISNKLFASPANRQQQVDAIGVITSTFPTPDSKYFNTNSIDPTQLIRIGNNTNQAPFNGT